MTRALTGIEKTVSMLVAWGATTKQVAALLEVSSNEVEGHLSRIRQELDVGSRDELATKERSDDTELG